MFEDVGSSWHVHNVIDNKLAESRQQISPLVQRLNLVGFILLVSLYRQKKTSNELSGSFKKKNKNLLGTKTKFLITSCPLHSLTHTLTLIVLVDEDVVQDKV